MEKIIGTFVWYHWFRMDSHNGWWPWFFFLLWIKFWNWWRSKNETKIGRKKTVDIYTAQRNYGGRRCRCTMIFFHMLNLFFLFHNKHKSFAILLFCKTCDDRSPLSVLVFSCDHHASMCVSAMCEQTQLHGYVEVFLVFWADDNTAMMIIMRMLDLKERCIRERRAAPQTFAHTHTHHSSILVQVSKWRCYLRLIQFNEWCELKKRNICMWRILVCVCVCVWRCTLFFDSSCLVIKLVSTLSVHVWILKLTCVYAKDRRFFYVGSQPHIMYTVRYYFCVKHIMPAYKKKLVVVAIWYDE